MSTFEFLTELDYTPLYSIHTVLQIIEDNELEHFQVYLSLISKWTDWLLMLYIVSIFIFNLCVTFTSTFPTKIISKLQGIS